MTWVIRSANGWWIGKYVRVVSNGNISSFTHGREIEEATHFEDRESAVIAVQQRNAWMNDRESLYDIVELAEAVAIDEQGLTELKELGIVE